MSSNSAAVMFPGKIVIISSPSGGGKTSITRKLLSKHKKDNWRFSISVTTRPKRSNEKDGREYFFRDNRQFDELRSKKAFAESCRVHGYQYGTPRDQLDRTLKSGGVILLDIDFKGAVKIKREYPEAVSMFILPPSRAELERRLKSRGTESAENLKRRLHNSLYEMKQYHRFDYTVINDDLDRAASVVEAAIISSGALKKYLDTERIRRIIG